MNGKETHAQENLPDRWNPSYSDTTRLKHLHFISLSCRFLDNFNGSVMVFVNFSGRVMIFDSFSGSVMVLNALNGSLMGMVMV